MPASAFRYPTAVVMALLAGLWAAAPPARADAPAPAVARYVMTGTIGPYRVGMTLTLRDHTQILAGHYYYATRLLDLPLGIGSGLPDIALTEPGDGVFHLHLVGNASSQPPLTFYNTVGLAGTWSKAGRTLPVELRFGTVRDGEGGERWYAAVTEQPDADYEALVRRFLQGAIAGDRRATAQAVSYPLVVNGRHPLRIADAAALRAHWDAIFTPRYVALLRGAMPHEMFVRDGQAMVADGAAWFDARGATALNIPD